MGRRNPTENSLLSSLRLVPYAVYVTAQPGEPLADGSPDMPYGLRSAARENYASQLHQAMASFADPYDVVDAGATRVIVCDGGVYPDVDLTVRASVPFITILLLGLTAFGADTGRTWTWIPEPAFLPAGAAPQLALVSLLPAPDDALLTSRISVGDTGAGIAKGVQLRGVRVTGSILDDATQNLGATVVTMDGGGADTVNLAAGRLRAVNRAALGTLVDVAQVDWLHHVQSEANIIVAGAGDGWLLDSQLAGNWTGPAGTFLADQVTLQNFGGVFAGGAGAGDVIEA